MKNAFKNAEKQKKLTAKNVADILKKVGVKDIDFFGPDRLGIVFTNPGNNPWQKGIKGWCLKHGVRVNLHEMEAYHNKYNFTDTKERRKQMDETHDRYENCKKFVHLAQHKSKER